MTFKTLAERFSESSQDIYKRFSVKTQPTDQPYINILPDTNQSRSRIKDDTRILPVVSTQRDTSRISQFLKSSDGRLFISRQLLLQAGNTFENTRLYNPLSTVVNTVPFLHIKRNLSPSLGIRPSVAGLLQNGTILDVSSRMQLSGVLNAISSRGIRGVGTTVVRNAAATFLKTQLKRTIAPFVPQQYNDSRPEFKVFYDSRNIGPVVFDPQPLNMRSVPKINVVANIKAIVTNKVRSTLTKVASVGINKILPKSLKKTIQIPKPVEEQKIPAFSQAAQQFSDNFYKDIRLKQTIQKRPRGLNRLNSSYLQDKNPGDDSNTSTNPAEVSSIKSGGSDTESGFTIIQDPYNIPKPITNKNLQERIDYDNIRTPIDNLDREGKTDIIKFIFSEVGGNNIKPVQFRALVSSIKESIKPEFNEQRYVGRTERFVTYGGVKRGLNLAFNIVAFSSDELEGMWSRINYLSGLTFPKTVTNGFMVPPLFNVTVGELFNNQPCYIEMLDYDFLDESITFDIDKEVPFAINVNMQLNILEKRSRFFDSPFYKITEDIYAQQRQRANIANSLRPF